MALLNPALFVIGAATLVVPLWVHLRVGKVRKRATVGSLRLLRASPQTSRRPRKLVNPWLLLLRSVIVLLLALGFGRLLLPWLGQDAAIQSTAIVLDVSGSVRARSGDRTCWDFAKSAALKYLDHLAPSARVALFLSPSGGARPEWLEPAAARATIRKLEPGFAANQLHLDILAAVAALQVMPDDQPKILDIISDFQRSSLAGIDQLAIPQGIQLQLTRTSPEHPVNRGIEVTVAEAGASNLRLYAFNDGTPGEISLFENHATNPVTIPAGRLLAAPTPAPGPDGLVSRKLRLNDPDDLTADDVAFDLFRPSSAIPVWLWQSRQTAQRIKSEMDRPTYFLACALQPAMNPGESISLFRPITVSEDNLTTTNLPPLLLIPAEENCPAALVAAAGAIVTNGGSVILFGGKALTEKTLAAFGPLAPVVPGVIEQVSERPALAPIGFDHPLFGALGSEERLRLAASPLFQRHNIALKPSTRVLASFADGKPFIVEADVAAGRVYFVNTSADREFGDWPADAPRFVPAVHLLAAKAIEKKFHPPDDAPFVAGVARPLRLDAALAGKTVVIEGASRRVEPNGSVGEVMFSEPGEKPVLLDGRPVCRLAVNFPPSESALDNLSESIVRQRLESQRQLGGGTSVRWEANSAGQLGWQLCLLLASLLLLIEPLVADWKSRSTATAGAPSEQAPGPVRLVPPSP